MYGLWGYEFMILCDIGELGWERVIYDIIGENVWFRRIWVKMWFIRIWVLMCDLWEHEENYQIIMRIQGKWMIYENIGK